jgi:hypothetical protein
MGGATSSAPKFTFTHTSRSDLGDDGKDGNDGEAEDRNRHGEDNLENMLGSRPALPVNCHGVLGIHRGLCTDSMICTSRHLIQYDCCITLMDNTVLIPNFSYYCPYLFYDGITVPSSVVYNMDWVGSTDVE